jgi:hypothetical protein
VLPEDCVGFVYLITNKLTGRKYIGKKLAKFSRDNIQDSKTQERQQKEKENTWQNRIRLADLLRQQRTTQQRCSRVRQPKLSPAKFCTTASLKQNAAI